MKTATVTWITHNNYGTMLQAYALQQCLSQMNIENEIIYDKEILYSLKNNQKRIEEQYVISSYEKRKLQKISERFYKYALHPCIFIKSLCKYIEDKKYTSNAQKFKEYQNIFEEFKTDYLNILEGFTREKLEALNEKYDVFLCGSDQIWSVLEQNFDGYYYLNFATKKKISYAASIGTIRIDENHSQQISAWLQDFSAISVREMQTAKQLEKIINKNVEWVADPTLLHDGSFWNNFCANVSKPTGKYLLCYFLTEKPWYFKYATKMAKQMNLKMILIPTNPVQLNRKECYDQLVGPLEFVSLIQHAQYVLTDSYHGSIFSMLFEKNFTYLKRFEDSDLLCQNIRIYSLFEKVGLLEHIIEEKDFEYTDVKSIDYLKVGAILQDFRKCSREFLQNALVTI